MRFPFFHRVSTQDLVFSRLFDQNTFYSKFARDISQCREELIIESPFITMRRLNVLLPQLKRLVKRGVKVVINTRHPNEHEDYLRSEAESALPLLEKAGVAVLFTGGHHRKIAILDRQVLWEGSLNILSYSDSCEMMRRIESPALAEEMFSFLKIARLI